MTEPRDTPKLTYKLKAFPNNAQPEEVEAALNEMAADGWEVAAAGAFFNSHMVYFVKKSPSEPVAPSAT